MSEPPPDIVVLTSVPTEAEAVMLVAQLADAGIEAKAAGQFTSGWRAEVPGDVRILVRSDDADRARAVLAGEEPIDDPE